MSLKILVPVKRVVDPNVRVRVGSTGSVETTGLKMSLNPFDECALEMALRLREAGHAAHVSVITCGLPVCQDVLRTGLAMGADDAVLIDTGDAALDPVGVARLLHAWLDTSPYDLVLCGKQAIDDDTGGVAPMLAGLLGWPQGLDATALVREGDGWRVVCGDDSGTATWLLVGRAVISADLRLAEPRRVTLPGIVKAKQKPLAIVDASRFAVDLAPASRTVRLDEPSVQRAGHRVADVDALLTALAAHHVFSRSGASA
ncbi:electron transfer flavoprotein subunit beta/FixA family protein [Paraburkholderia sp. SUR17]|uniref:electron transfer flavoprotein subunit beta/FixA family protein n=1 Tax=Paraburkholderia sp. SUR17 TaxID=3034358 RepID=UPI0024080137|nr:electron transfer flavoprotein subunit beta/FixA family protein [Paraburkholderia sp. SUR17]WEY42285.1 electron transfer flavoprotein subunit beta/FixA family protein [Paraburkholderia sp. SUR17]